VDSGQGVRDGVPDEEWSLTGRDTKRKARGGGGIVAESGPEGFWLASAIPGDRQPDAALPLCHPALRVQPELQQGPRSSALEYDIDPLEKREQGGTILGITEVQGQVLLSSIQQVEEGPRPSPSPIRAPGALDLDDACAGRGEQLAAEWSRPQRGEVCYQRRPKGRGPDVADLGLQPAWRGALGRCNGSDGKTQQMGPRDRVPSGLS